MDYQDVKLVSFLEPNFETDFDPDAFDLIDIPLQLIVADNVPIKPHHQTTGRTTIETFLPWILNTPKIEYKSLSINMAILKIDLQKMVNDAFRLFPFLDITNNYSPTDETGIPLFKQYVNEVIEMLAYNVKKEKEGTPTLTHIFAKVLDFCQYEPDNLKQRLRYWNWHDRPAENAQEIINSIIKVSIYGSEFCEFWLPLVCQLFLVKLRSKSFFLMKKDENVTLPSWFAVTSHTLISQMIYLVYMKNTEQFWDYQRDPSHIPKPLVDLFAFILRQVPQLTTFRHRHCPLSEEVIEKVKQLSKTQLVDHIYPYTLTLGMSSNKRIEFLATTYLNQLFNVGDESKSEQKETAYVVFLSIVVYCRLLLKIIGEKNETQPEGVFIDSHILNQVDNEMAECNKTMNSNYMSLTDPTKQEIFAKSLAQTMI